MRSSVLFLAFVLVSVSVMAQDYYRVYGNITDEDGQPYPNMKVALDETEHETMTDADGFYVFEEVEEGEYAVIIDHPYGAIYRALYLY